MDTEGIIASSKEESEDLTSCSVCFFRFDMLERKPKFLPCSHTFCLSCLKSMSSAGNDVIDCPVCRKPFLTITSVEVLPNNIYALQIIKMSQIMSNSQQLIFTPRWCLTCKSVAKESCINSHSTISLAQDGEELQRKLQESEKNMNDSLEKRAQIQIHLDAVLKSLEEAQHSAQKEADENTQHTFNLMAALENVDKLKNGKQDVTGAREKIETIFNEAETELQSASQLMLEYQDQTEIRVWIEKTPLGKSCFSIPKPPVSYSDLVKTTETKRICPSEDKERIICCAINPFRPILITGLESGKLGLFQEEDDCDFEPFSDWKASVIETSSTSLVSFVDWDLKGTTFAVGFADGLVQVWSGDFKKSFELKIHSMTIGSILWNPNNDATQLFLTNSIDESVAVWSATLKTIVQQFSFESEVCDVVWVSADSFVCFDEGNIFNMHQIGKDEPIRTFHHDVNDSLMELCFRDRLASSSGDGYIKIWSLEEDESVRQYSTDSPVYSIDWSPHTNEDSDEKDDCQQLLASGLESGLVHIWDVSDVNSISPFVTLEGHTDSVSIVYFSRDGKLLATISDRNNVLMVWSTKSWEKVYETTVSSEGCDSREPPFLSWTSSKILATAIGEREITVTEFD